MSEAMRRLEPNCGELYAPIRRAGSVFGCERERGCELAAAQ
jgi:hypothetical protein